MKLIPFFALLIILGSCKKEMEQPIAEHALSSQRGGTPCTKVDLTDYGGGVYKANYEGFTVTVTNLSYLLFSNGVPLPLRDGDPAFGTIAVDASAGQGVLIQPTAPENHFALSMLTWGVDNFISSSYSTALNNATTDWLTAVSAYNNLTPSQQLDSPFPVKKVVHINAHIQSGSNGSTGVKIFTGKLIRSTTGSSTFAIACEAYTEPDPLTPPPAQVDFNKVATINGTIVTFDIVYSNLTQSILEITAVDGDCMPVSVSAFTSATFLHPDRFNWTTTSNIVITTSIGTATVTGNFAKILSFCP